MQSSSCVQACNELFVSPTVFRARIRLTFPFIQDAPDLAEAVTWVGSCVTRLHTTSPYFSSERNSPDWADLQPDHAFANGEPHMRRCARLADAGRPVLSQLQLQPCSAVLKGARPCARLWIHWHPVLIDLSTLDRTFLSPSMQSLGTTGLAHPMRSATFGSGIVQANPTRCLDGPVTANFHVSSESWNVYDLRQHISPILRIRPLLKRFTTTATISVRSAHFPSLGILKARFWSLKSEITEASR